MSLNEYDHVLVKSKGVTGTIVEIFTKKGDGRTVYIVEDDEQHGVDYPLYDCLADDLEKIE